MTNTTKSWTQRGKSRIFMRNEVSILGAARTVFAENGFKGARVDDIARLAGMSQSNLHNYFKTKQDLYLRILDDLLTEWLDPINEIDPEGDPRTELRQYVTTKLEMSRSSPESSRIFAHEMLDGAPRLKPLLETIVCDQADAFAHVLKGWIERGALRPVDPYHLLFMLWATTQHYADFAPQILTVLRREELTEGDFETAAETICTLLFLGLSPSPEQSATS